jgi:hypothetical protein
LKSRAEDVLKPRIETVLNPSPDGHLTSIKLCGEVRRAAASANDESAPQQHGKQAVKRRRKPLLANPMPMKSPSYFRFVSVVRFCRTRAAM